MQNEKKLKEISDLLSRAKEAKVQLELLELFFTPAELCQLVARYEIIKGLLKQKQTQRELAAELKLSIAKITRGSNELKKRSPKLKAYLNSALLKQGQAS